MASGYHKVREGVINFDGTEKTVNCGFPVGTLKIMVLDAEGAAESIVHKTASMDGAYCFVQDDAGDLTYQEVITLADTGFTIDTDGGEGKVAYYMATEAYGQEG